MNQQIETPSKQVIHEGTIRNLVSEQVGDKSTHLVTLDLEVEKAGQGTGFFQVKVWRDLADKVLSEFVIGDKVRVTCRAQTSNYTAKSGANRSNTQYVAEFVMKVVVPKRPETAQTR